MPERQEGVVLMLIRNTGREQYNPLDDLKGVPSLPSG